MKIELRKISDIKLHPQTLRVNDDAVAASIREFGSAVPNARLIDDLAEVFELSAYRTVGFRDARSGSRSGGGPGGAFRGRRSSRGPAGQRAGSSR